MGNIVDRFSHKCGLTHIILQYLSLANSGDSAETLHIASGSTLLAEKTLSLGT